MKQLIFMSACAVLVGSAIAVADEKLVDLVKQIKPGVVLIKTFDKDDNPLGQGSGFFVNSKGHIVTNYHVIEGAYSATIKTFSGNEYHVEGIIARDTEADIVKLHVNVPNADITFLNLNTNVPAEGEDIFVIGSPLGLESTVSTGIVSAVRDIPAFGKIIQLTAPVSAGSSGSPVINSKGGVIGIATLIVTSGQNLNFAVPSDKIIALKEIARTPIAAEYASLTADSNDVQSFYDKGLKELWQENWMPHLHTSKRQKKRTRRTLMYGSSLVIVTANLAAGRMRSRPISSSSESSPITPMHTTISVLPTADLAAGRMRSRPLSRPSESSPMMPRHTSFSALPTAYLADIKMRSRPLSRPSESSPMMPMHTAVSVLPTANLAAGRRP